jgi:hypothetical protein
MSIMDFFRAAPTPASTNAPAPTPAPAPTSSGTPAPNGQTGNHNTSGATNTPVNPLDAYSKMYDNTNKATPEVAPTFALDNETVGKVTNSLDFTKSVPAELMTKALAGDAQALIEAMNHVGRGAYQTSLQHQSMLTDKFVGSRLDFEGKQLGSKVKSELTSSALSSAPNYQHPVVKAELNRIANMLQQQHPDATPQQIAESAQKYLMDLNGALTPQSQQQQQSKEEFDWASYLTK